METNKGFRYAAEKLNAARRGLMLPHPSGEDHDIWSALHECWHGLRDIRRDELDPNARKWLAELDELRGPEELPSMAEVARLSVDQRFALSRVISDLADWFDACD